MQETGGWWGHLPSETPPSHPAEQSDVGQCETTSSA